MRIGSFIGILTLMASQWAYAGAAKDLYFKCENEPGQRFRECISRGVLSDRTDLTPDFDRRLKFLDEYLNTGRSDLLDKRCQDAYIKFVKVGRDRVRLMACKANGKCRILSREITLVLTQAQRDQILKERGTPVKKTNIFGQEYTVIEPIPKAIETSCNRRDGLCFRVIKEVVGFDHVADKSTKKFGSYGVIHKKVDPDFYGIGQGKRTVYEVKKLIAYVAPFNTMIERMGDLYSNRQTGPVAHLVDRAMNEEKARNIVFNLHLVSVLRKRLAQFARSLNKEMKFSFINGDKVCADEIYQKNRVRRGMNIDEAFLLRKKDTSGDLAHTIGKSFKIIGDGFTVIVKEFYDNQLVDPITDPVLHPSTEPAKEPTVEPAQEPDTELPNELDADLDSE